MHNNLNNVLVIGDLMLDVTIEGTVSRISPEAPVPVILNPDEKVVLGGAANVCANLVSLGASVSLHTCVGDDTFGQIAKGHLEKLGVAAEFVGGATVTTQKVRYMANGQQICRVDFEKYADISLPERYANFAKALQQGNISTVVFSDYSKGMLRNIKSELQLCKQLNIRSIVDPKSSNIENYQGCFLLTPNEKEFCSFFNHTIEAEDYVESAKFLMSEHSIKNILITMSERGMLLIEESGTVKKFPAVASEVFDVTGAGDTVVATLAYCLAIDDDLPAACINSSIAASIAVSKSGTYSVTRKELLDKILADTNLLKQTPVYSLKENKVEIQNLRKVKNLVFTNGCFDIVHVGHVECLEYAKTLGDFLVVGLNSDLSVRNLKGDQRPINLENHRAKLLSSMKYVDAVVIFDEDTPYELVKILQPDIIVKGGDYEVSEVVGNDIVAEKNGHVMIYDFKTQISTTEIIRRCSKRST